MTRDDLAKYPRKTAKEILAEARLGALPTRSLELLVECALNLEWWRGYHAATSQTISTNSST